MGKPLKIHCEYMGYYSRNSLAETLEMLGLLEAADKPVKRYSLGMKQSITKHTESLEDYFLKLTEEVEKSC